MIKKIVIITCIIILTTFNKAWCALTVIETGGTVVGSGQISQGITATISSPALTTVNVQAAVLSPSITSTSNPSIVIPISSLYLNDGIYNYQMEYNTPVTVLNGVNIDSGGYTQNYTAIINPIGPIPPGTYTTLLQFTDSLGAQDTFSYNLNFTVPLNQAVSSTANTVNITLAPADVFDKSGSFTNLTSPQISLQSNSDWDLILDTTNIGDLNGNYYFQVLNATSNVTSCVSTPTQISSTQYQIASGNPTVTDPVNGTWANDYITIQFSMQNPFGNYTPQGNYLNNVTYTIQETN